MLLNSVEANKWGLGSSNSDVAVRVHVCLEIALAEIEQHEGQK